MPQGSRKSHSYRRVFRRVPSGVSRLFYKKRKPSKAVCICGQVLKGVACATPTKMQNMAKTAKRPERPFGGVLCGQCMRNVMIAKARSMTIKTE